MEQVAIYLNGDRPVMRQINRSRTRANSRYQAVEAVSPASVSQKVANGYAFIREGDEFEDLVGADATAATVDETHPQIGKALRQEADNARVEAAIVNAVQNPVPYLRQQFPPHD